MAWQMNQTGPTRPWHYMNVNILGTTDSEEWTQNLTTCITHSKIPVWSAISAYVRNLEPLYYGENYILIIKLIIEFYRILQLSRKPGVSLIFNVGRIAMLSSFASLL